MKSWSEGVFALLLVGGLGWGLLLISGDDDGHRQTTGTTSVPVDAGSASRGQLVAEQQGCFQCHTVDGGVSTGPTFKGVAGSMRPLDTGDFVRADETYLKTSIVDPSSQIVDGFNDEMPDDFGTLSGEDIADLISFIQSLGS